MSAVAERLCDGCGLKGSQIPLKSLDALDYCEPCMESVGKFLEEVGDLYERQAKVLAEELMVIRKRYALVKNVPLLSVV